MDIFSAGCVIAEVFMEQPLFDLMTLQQYKQGNYNPLDDLQKKVEDP